MHRAEDVCYSAKIGILKQITTGGTFNSMLSGCLLLCKDRNFKANHNLLSKYAPLSIDVCYSAKIGILKQITTHEAGTDRRSQMFVTLQR